MKTDCPTCDGTGKRIYSCCGNDITDYDIMICPECKEHCGDEPENCDECGGSGEVEV